ncbi:hypothetical protein EON66_08910 [archaeon]|nr:MAG: hypothetical protein EON66_08910 [archaeon]
MPSRSRRLNGTSSGTIPIEFDVRDDQSTPDGVTAVVQAMYADGIRIFASPQGSPLTLVAVTALDAVRVPGDDYVLVSGSASTWRGMRCGPLRRFRRPPGRPCTAACATLVRCCLYTPCVQARLKYFVVIPPPSPSCNQPRRPQQRSST